MRLVIHSRTLDQHLKGTVTLVLIDRRTRGTSPQIVYNHNEAILEDDTNRPFPTESKVIAQQ